MRADLPHPAVGRKQGDPGGVESRALRRDVHVPAVSRDTPERQRGDERGGPERGLLRSGPRARSPCAADPSNALVAGDAAHHASDGRHQVDVPVRVPGEREDPPGAGQRRLGADLARELSRADAAAEHAFGELGEAQKATVIIHEAPDRGRIAHRPPANKVDVQADLEVGLHPGLGCRLGG